MTIKSYSSALAGEYVAASEDSSFIISDIAVFNGSTI